MLDHQTNADLNSLKVYFYVYSREKYTEPQEARTKNKNTLKMKHCTTGQCTLENGN